MPFGYTGKILHVNLTNKEYHIETPEDLFYKTYLGGGCMGAYYLLKDMKKGIDPLSSENVLVFAASIITGAQAPGLSKHTVMAKSPLTNAIGESQSEGYWAAELKYSGFDCVVIKGKSHVPVYLYINDNNVIIKDAEHLWGKDTGETIDIIKNENSDSKIKVAVIGKSGENRVKYSSIINDYCFANQRTGMGAVMGSKNLKAVAVRGSNTIQVFDMEKVRQIAEDFKMNLKKSSEGKLQCEYGTAYDAHTLHDMGIAVSRNFSSDQFLPYKKICRFPYENNIVDHTLSCFGCFGECKKILRFIEGPFESDTRYGFYEYDSLAALGGSCCIDDFYYIQKAYELCCRYSLDPVSTGATIAFAMECFENGIITKSDTGGLSLEFGSKDALIELIELIADRRGIGNILAEGTRLAAASLGKEAGRFAVEVKGKELPMHEPRVKVMLALGYAVSPNGPDYCVVEHDTDFDFEAPDEFLEKATPLGVHNRLESTYIGSEKIRLFYSLQNYWSFMEVIDACIFMTAPVRYLKLSSLVELVSAITGWETSLWELMKAGERRINMMRVFNIREGFGKKDDWLPERVFQPIADGPMIGKRLKQDDVRRAIDLYYDMMNWDSEGIPRVGKLAELGIEWAAEYLD